MSSPELLINGPVARITLRRPAQANRLEPDDLAALVDHVAAVNDNADVRVLQLVATGKYFCSGYDINRIGASSRNVAFDAMVDAIEDARPVTIAALQGSVYGGGTDLALACDFRLGVHGMETFMPAARLGLHFYQRGMERYFSRIGLNAAKRMFLTCETLPADEMKAVGFLTHLVAPADLDTTCEQLSQTVAQLAPLAVQGMKKHLNSLARGPIDTELFQTDFKRAATSEDLTEGQRAWVEKRRPVFQGR